MRPLENLEAVDVTHLSRLQKRPDQTITGKNEHGLIDKLIKPSCFINPTYTLKRIVK